MPTPTDSGGHTTGKRLVMAYHRKPGHNHAGLCFGCLLVEVEDVGALCPRCAESRREAQAEDAFEAERDARRDEEAGR